MDKILLKEAYGVRCPGDRPHGPYGSCGRLLFLVHDGALFVRCPECKKFYKIEILRDDIIRLLPVDSRMKIKLESAFRIVE